MLREDLIDSLCDFAANHSIHHLHFSMEARDEEMENVGQVEGVFAASRKYLVWHLDEREDAIRAVYRDDSPGISRAYMGPNVDAPHRTAVLNAIVERVLN